MTVGVYAGSFDPITHGHLSIIDQASHAFDHVIVAIGLNSNKRHIMSQTTRYKLVCEVTKGFENVEVRTFEGLLATFCKSLQREKTVIVRGLRAVSDFEYEMAISHLNGKVSPDIPTVFFPTPAELAFVSSSAARELVLHKDEEEAVKALEAYVPNVVKVALLTSALLEK